MKEMIEIFTTGLVGFVVFMVFCAVIIMLVENKYNLGRFFLDIIAACFILSIVSYTSYVIGKIVLEAIR
jgi:hypothetical protein